MALRRFTVIMLRHGATKAAHRIKARNAKAAADAYNVSVAACRALGTLTAADHNVIAVVHGWPEISGVDEKE